MRTEEEMFALIRRTAVENKLIRAVYMNGSRTDRNVPKDIFQDYDIVYVVTETKPFYTDETFINRFGARLCMQMPEKLDALIGHPANFDENFGWLIQFKDGNRLDLHVQSIPYAREAILADKLCVVLLDKDGVLPPIPPPSDADYHVKRPREQDFFHCCNEFWWCQNNVAKGLWRKEIPYVMEMINDAIRPQLIRMLSWKIGIQTGFSCSIGKSGKYLGRLLDERDYHRFLQTYPDARIESIWASVFAMCDSFDGTAPHVARKLGFTYDWRQAHDVRGFLEHVKALPGDAVEIYPGKGGDETGVS